jgi:hypothetical protein
MGDRPIFLKSSAPRFLMTTDQMNLLPARSISPDSTFNIHHSQVIGINITTLEFNVFYFEYEEPTYSSNSSRQ